MDLARFRSVRRMSGDGHEGDYRTVAIAVEEMRGEVGKGGSRGPRSRSGRRREGSRRSCSREVD